MFSWVAKVVPQPPDPPGKLGEEEKASPPIEKKVTFKVEVPKPKEVPKPAPPKPKEEEVTTEETSAQPRVLTWLSQGLSSALPQPAGSPKQSRANPEDDSPGSKADEAQGSGVIGWIVQGLEKIVPHPDGKHKEESSEPEETTEVAEAVEIEVQPSVHEMKDVPDAEPLPHIPVVEVISDDEGLQDESQANPTSVIKWLKHGFEKVVPQPVDSHSEVTVKKEIVLIPPPAEALKTLENSQMVGWIVTGLGRIIPQPVLKTGECEPVQNGRLP